MYCHSPEGDTAALSENIMLLFLLRQAGGVMWSLFPSVCQSYCKQDNSRARNGCRPNSVDMCKGWRSRSDKLLVFIRIRMWIPGQYFILFTIAEWFLSVSLYFSKRDAYWDMLCRDQRLYRPYGLYNLWSWRRWSLVGWLSRACTVAKRCILGL